MEKEVLEKSYFGGDITLYTIGKGKKRVLFFGDFGGGTSEKELIFRFMEDLENQGAGGEPHRVGKISVDFLKEARTISFLPLPNPDGEKLRKRMFPKEHPFYEKAESLLKRSGESSFDSWRANGRGVDLLHNFDFHFSMGRPFQGPFGYHGEYPESEGETRGFCRFVREKTPLVSIGITKGKGLSAPLVVPSQRLLSYATSFTSLPLIKNNFSSSPEGWISKENKGAALRIGINEEENVGKLYGKLRLLLFSLAAY